MKFSNNLIKKTLKSIYEREIYDWTMEHRLTNWEIYGKTSTNHKKIISEREKIDTMNEYFNRIKY